MKKIICLVVLFAFVASSVCFAAEAAKETKSKAKDPITATCEVAGKTAVAPVEAVFGGKKKEATKDVKKAPAKKK